MQNGRGCMYKKLSEDMYEDFTDWLLANHGGDLKWIYELYINEYLNKRLGDLNDKAYRELKKNLLGMLIS